MRGRVDKEYDTYSVSVHIYSDIMDVKVESCFRE